MVMSETRACAIINAFAHRLSGITSAGLNAVALVERRSRDNRRGTGHRVKYMDEAALSAGYRSSAFAERESRRSQKSDDRAASARVTGQSPSSSKYHSAKTKIFVNQICAPVRSEESGCVLAAGRFSGRKNEPAGKGQNRMPRLKKFTTEIKDDARGCGERRVSMCTPRHQNRERREHEQLPK